MISIVVISVEVDFLRRLKKNISETIDLEMEIVGIKNTSGKWNLSTAYNLAARKCRYPYLLFVHEDIFFHSKGWGIKLIQYFESLSNPGILGIAGSSYLPISPSDWWLCKSEFVYANLISNDKNGVVGNGVLKEYGEQIPQRVFALDGIFLAMKKSIWEEFPFDESLDGFHGYDTSISYRVSQKYQNYFVPGILLEHFSKGYPNETWLINTVKANQSIHNFKDEFKKSSIIDKQLEVKSYHLFLNQLRKYSKSYKYMVIQSWRYLLRNLKHYFHFRLILLWAQFQLVFIYKSLSK